MSHDNDDIFPFDDEDTKEHKPITPDTPFGELPLGAQLTIIVLIILAIFVLAGLLNKFAGWAFGVNIG